MRIIDLFDRSALNTPGRACTIDLDSGAQRSYREVQRASHQIARALIAMGASPGTTKVATWSPNAGRALECILGVLRSGAVWAPVNARNGLQDNCYLLDLNDVEILLYHPDVADDLDAVRRACPKIRAYVRMQGASQADRPSVDDWLAAPFGEAPELPEQPDAPMAHFGSGGTTGRPKGVVHPHRLWECMAVNVNVSLPPRSPHPVHLVAAPMTHAAGALLLSLLAVSATHVLMHRFEAHAVLDAIERHRVTHLFLPPTAIYMLLAEPSARAHDYASLEYFVYAAAPMSVQKVREAIDVFGPVMVQTYGLSEAGPFIGTCFSPAQHQRALAENPARLASCGRPTLLTKLRIVDDAGRTLGAGETGEIAIGGDFQMKEYYRNPEATEAARVDGWVLSGDIGRMDDEGFVYIVDRKREMIITGGFNVFPGEIEQAIFMHPAVQDCAVVGVPDAKWGEAVKAVVQLRPGGRATEHEIVSICRDRLGGVMAPKSVEFWPDLPRSAVGKVMRRAVRERFWQGRERKLV